MLMRFCHKDKIHLPLIIGLIRCIYTFLYEGLMLGQSVGPLCDFLFRQNWVETAQNHWKRDMDP